MSGQAGTLGMPGPEFDDALPERSEVVVVGGGIAGASAAFHLARAGVETTLLERGRVAGGATAAAVGILSPPLRQPFHETAHDRGPEVARQVWDFALRSVRGLGEALEELGVSEEAELDLSGGYVLAESHTQHEVGRSYEALDEAGVRVDWLDAGTVRSLTGGRGFHGGFRIAGLGSLDPRAATRALARAASDAGAAIVEGVGVDGVEPVEGGALRCRVGDREIRCEMVVYATHIDSRRFSRLLGDEIVPIRGQGLALELDQPFPTGGAFASHWKLNVWRRVPGDPRRVLLGGWRHDAWDRAYWKTKAELDEQLQEDLLNWFTTAFPSLGPAEVTGRWSGVFGWTADYLPMVGALPGSPRELVVGGFSGGGLPFAFESGRAVAHAVAGKEPVPGSELFAPRRFV